jgi:hypothetical protein
LLRNVDTPLRKYIASYPRTVIFKQYIFCTLLFDTEFRNFTVRNVVSVRLYIRIFHLRNEFTRFD